MSFDVLSAVGQWLYIRNFTQLRSLVASAIVLSNNGEAAQPVVATELISQ